jgi:serine/threonine protein kinase
MQLIFCSNPGDESMAIACPHCKSPLTLPQPAPERMPCPHCQAILRFAPAKSVGAIKSPAATSAVGGVQTSTARMVAGYELQRELARGGLGVVYLAYHPHLKHYRAIKRPQPRADLDNDTLLARFRREMEALGALDSKHVIRAYDAGADGEGPYLVTEYLDGESLSSLVARHRRLPVSEACELARQAALGLQSAHECGIVHRDIKPSNLMLTRAAAGTARTVVIDWGLVKRMGEADVPAHRLTKIRADLGTPDYIAPEQIVDAHTVDIRADIYSLGVTLYFLLAGQAPFQGRTNEQKLLAQAKEPFPPLSPGRTDIPKPVMDILVKMVRKNPADRFQTPGEVAAALQPFACAEPHRMLALLAPVPIAAVAPNDTNRILDEKTQIAPPPPIAASQPGPQSQRIILWLAAAAGLLVVLSACVAVSAIMMFKGKETDTKGKVEEHAKDVGNKDKLNSALPKVFIKEDFRNAHEKKTMPDGWDSDAFRVEKLSGEPYLEVSKAAGVHFVTLPPVSLKGDFVIEGNYIIDMEVQALVIELESRKTNVFLPVTLRGNGSVLILDDTLVAPTNYKGGPTQFVLKREGKKLRVFLNGDVVGVKDLPAVTEYETIKIGMNAGVSRWGIRSKLSFFKVTALP